MSDHGDEELDASRKQMMRGLKEKDLYRFFRDRFRENWISQIGKVNKAECDVACREAWRHLPLATLEGVITAYKLKLDRDAAMARANKSLEDFKKKQKSTATTCDKCKATNCDGKCSGHNEKKAARRCRRKRKDSDGRGSGKNPDKKDEGKSSRKKSEERNSKKEGKDDENRHRDDKRKRSKSAKRVCKKKKVAVKPPSRSSSDDSESECDSIESEREPASRASSHVSGGYESSSSSEQGSCDSESDSDSE